MARQISVLLVEDDEDDKILTQALFDAIDEPEYAVTWARTVDEGLHHLTTGAFDVCILDFSLGDRTGLELLAEVQVADIEVPIVFLTGHSERAGDVEATRLGAADYLEKGKITAGLLERSVRYAMERAHSLSTLRQLNRELELTRNQAIDANRAKSSYLAAVTRSCRETVVALIDHSAALDRHLAGGDPQAAVHTRAIQAHGERLLTLLTEAIAVGETGEVIDAPPLEIRRLDLAPFVDEIARAILPLAGHNDNSLDLACPPDIGAIETDPLRLRSILLNLLANTCKFTRRGRIQLSLARLPARGDAPEQLEVVIRPSGLWLSPAQLELLYARAPRAEAGDAPRSRGDEQGIAGCRRACRSLGGDLLVETEGSRRPVLRICVPVRPWANPG